MHIPQQLKDAYRVAVKTGWSISRDGNDHLVWVSPAGKRVVTTGTNIGNYRSVMNYLSDLRRAGLDVPSRRRPPKKKAARAAA